MLVSKGRAGSVRKLLCGIVNSIENLNTYLYSMVFREIFIYSFINLFPLLLWITIGQYTNIRMFLRILDNMQCEIYHKVDRL